MIPCLTLTGERQELDAQHLVCSYLVRAIRHAMYELALEEDSDAEVRRRAIEVLKIVHQDWLEAQKAVVRELRRWRTEHPDRVTAIENAPAPAVG